MKKAHTTDLRSTPAQRQAKHYIEKRKSHVRKQVWVPKDRIKDFEKVLETFFR